jgi:hypothetical protein
VPTQLLKMLVRKNRELSTQNARRNLQRTKIVLLLGWRCLTKAHHFTKSATFSYLRSRRHFYPKRRGCCLVDFLAIDIPVRSRTPTSPIVRCGSPTLVRIVELHVLDDLAGIGPQILLVDDSIVANHECLYARDAIVSRYSYQCKPAIMAPSIM